MMFTLTLYNALVACPTKRLDMYVCLSGSIFPPVFGWVYLPLCVERFISIIYRQRLLVEKSANANIFLHYSFIRAEQ